MVNQCFLCMRTSERVVWRENGIEGRLCDCGMVYSDTGGQVITPTDLAMELHPTSFYARPARFKANWMAKHCPMGKLLEVGCSESSFLGAARELGYEIAAMEPHAGRAEQVSKRLGISVERTFIEQNTLPAASFDVVYHCDLLVHFPDPLRALASMTRLLKPGGVLCFEVGILGGISIFWYQLIREIGLGPHLYLYSYRALKMLLDRAELNVQHRADFCLAPETLLNMPLSVFTKYVLRTVFSAQRAERLRDHVYHAVRYRIGRYVPQVGPATVLLVVRPRVSNA